MKFIFMIILATQFLYSDNLKNREFENRDPHVEKILGQYFQESIQNKVVLLPGGYLEATNFCVDVNGKLYVLRMYGPDRSEKDMRREFYALEAASKKGIAPQVFSVFLEERAVLMDYIPGKTSSLSQSKEPMNRIKIAEALRKAHEIDKNPHSESNFVDRIEKFYAMLSQYTKDKRELVEAIEIIRAGQKELDATQFQKVNIHGDMNARNIFITEFGVQLIDWSETSWEHPYYDLTCFALMNAYTEEEERALLVAYLKRDPTPEERRQYFLVKKMNLAVFCLNCNGISLNLRSQSPQPIDPSIALKDWSFYMQTFSENKEELSAQFFSECARASLELANRL